MSSAELHRHRCEVRWCIANGSAWFKGFIGGVAQARGQAAADKLRNDVRAQAALGNTGKRGQWIDARQPELTT